jgi:hypothetical protein
MEVKLRAFLTLTLDVGDVSALIRTVTAEKAPNLTNRLLSVSAAHPPYVPAAINSGST